MHDSKKTEINKDGSNKDDSQTEKENKVEKSESDEFISNNTYHFETLASIATQSFYLNKNYTFFNNSYTGPPPEC